jgi:ABC-2 type transport system permease protein
MKTVLAILRREFAAYFNTPLGYILLVYLLVAYGVFFFYIGDVFESQLASMRGMFRYAPLVLAWTTPVVTMRLLAEERSSGTIELLMTMPVSEWQVVLGKYLAAVAVVALGTLLTLTYPITLARYGDLDLGPVVGGYLGLMLMAASYVALGTVCSALSGSQMVAALTGLVSCMLLWVIDKWALMVPGVTGELMRFVGFDHHFANIQRGVIDSRDLVYYATVVTLCLALAVHLLRRRRLAA